VAVLVAFLLSLALVFGGSRSPVAERYGHARPSVTPARRDSASLRFSSTHPVVIQGRNFRPTERVRLTVDAGQKTAQRVVQSSEGRFEAAFRGLAIDRCTGAFAVARRSDGTRIRAKLPLPACLPARSGKLLSRIP
jgi:hypothetical protein